MKNFSAPKITVLMPVYNAEAYLKEAIDSILNQTFKDFEFLIINDGSDDGSDKLIKSYTDRRIRIEHNNRNLGLNYSLNKGLDLSRGEYIARMDADDISLPNRFLVQVDFMNKNPSVGVCGSWLKYMDTGVIDKKPTDPNIIKAALFFNNQIGHPTVFIRKAFLLKHNLHYDTQVSAEDYELWVRCARYFRIANIPQVLYLWRQHEMQKTRYEELAIVNDSKTILKSQLNYMGIFTTEQELDLFILLKRGEKYFSFREINLLSSFLHRIIKKNLDSRFYHEPYFFRRIGSLWKNLMGNNAHFLLIPLFIRSPLRKYISWGNYRKTKFLFRCIMCYPPQRKKSNQISTPS